MPRIIPFAPSFRDDMIFMILEAQDALGLIPRLKEDLLDVQKNYLDKGDMFWLALDEHGRVVGCVGYSSSEDSSEVQLRRLYVKARLKRQGIGTALLQTAEEHIRFRGKTAILVHLGGPAYFESHQFYPKHGYLETAPSRLRKAL